MSQQIVHVLLARPNLPPLWTSPLLDFPSTYSRITYHPLQSKLRSIILLPNPTGLLETQMAVNENAHVLKPVLYVWGRIRGTVNRVLPMFFGRLTMCIYTIPLIRKSYWSAAEAREI